MPLLTKVEHRESGLEGCTEMGEWVPIEDPVPCIFRFEYAQARKGDVLESLKKTARKDATAYYQLADFQNAQPATSEIGILPYIAYLKRKS